MGARKLYEEQIIQLVHQAPEEKLPAILTHLKSEVLPVEKKARTKEEMIAAIKNAQGVLKGQLSSVDDFIKWKQEEKALEKW